MKAIELPSNLLRRMVEPGVFASLSAVDLGIVCKLIDYAWVMDERCSLPDDDQVLAAVVGTTPDDWTLRRPRVLRLLRAEKDLASGRINLTLADQVYREATAAAGRRAARTKKATDIAALKRNRARDQLERDGSVTDDLEAEMEGGAPPKRPAPKRSHSENESSALGARSEQCEWSAGARAPVHHEDGGASRGCPDGTDCQSISSTERGVGDHSSTEASLAVGKLKLSICERNRVHGMLTHAFWPWAEEFRRSLPREVIKELVGLQHVTPRLVAFVLQRVEEMHREAVAKSKQLPDPISLVIAGLGAKAPVNGRREPPWVIPPSFDKQWVREEAERDQLLEMQGRVNLLRERRGIREPFSKVNP